MRFGKKGLWCACALAALLVVALAAPAMRSADAAAQFAAAQSIEVTANGNSGVYIYNYTTEVLTWVDGPVSGGTYDVSYTLPTEQWLGFFVYDYETTRWEEAFYIYDDEVNWPA